MRLANKIIIATANKDKFAEFKSLFQTYPELEIIPASEVLRNSEKLGLAEKYSTYLENAIAKARLANQGCHYPCLADDSGLEVLALEGRPGVLTHRYALPKAGQSQSTANMEKLLGELKGKSGEQRQARFVATLTLVMEGLLLDATGVLEGQIAESPKGNRGFGYDPIFIPKGHQETLAELRDEEKNEISHRAVALRKLMEKIHANGISFSKP